MEKRKQLRKEHEDKIKPEEKKKELMAKLG